MNGLKSKIEHKLQEICKTANSDFTSLALIEENTQFIYWRYVFGNLNERYKNMVSKPGKGISGQVFRYGCVFVVDKNTPNLEKKRLEYPIMLAEKLQSAIAAPIVSNNKTIGVLLIGSRIIQQYPESLVSKVKEFANEMAEIITC